MIKLSSIKPNPDNPRIIKDHKFQQLVTSIKDFPKMMALRPMVVDAQGIVLGGNMRLKALQELKFKEVPEEWIKKADELTPEEIKRFIVVDNIGFGEHDWDSLANGWDMEELQEWGLDIPDFNVKNEIEEDDYEFADSIITDIVRGDLFELGDHCLLCGDSTKTDDVAKLMNGRKADMVFADPDFSMTFDILKECYSNSLLFSKGTSFWICGDKQAVQLAVNDFENFSYFYVHDFRIPNLISNNRSMQRHTLIAKFGGKGINNLKDGFSTLIEIATDRKERKKMPMAKKIQLPAIFIEHYTNKGDIILDLFGHSGSTLMAAEQLGRKCYIQEIEPKYCYAIVDRFLKKYPEKEILLNKEKYLHK